MANPLFILGSGRSGTTLLQRVLNTFDNITIWGEHAGFLKETAAAYFRLIETSGSREILFPNVPSTLHSREELRACTDPRCWQAWLNFFTESDATAFFRSHVESFFRHRLMDQDHIWGFKEIRYGGDRTIEFLSTLYPNATFVFICRDALNTVASQGKAFAAAGRLAQYVPTPHFVAACRRWREQNASLWACHTSGRLRSYWIRFEDLTADVESLQPLLSALGKKIGLEQRAVLTLDEGHGSAYGTTAPKVNDVTHRSATLGFLPLLAAEFLVGGLNDRLGYGAPAAVSWLRRFRKSIDPKSAHVPCTNADASVVRSADRSHRAVQGTR